MAYNDLLAARIENILSDIPDVVRKKMFGGIAFMVKDHMCVGVIDDMLMARVGPEQYENCLIKEFAQEMTFTGKPLTGMVYVKKDGITSESELKSWISICLDFVNTLPPKKKRG